MSVAKLAARDEAMHVRSLFQQARECGSGELARLMRNLMKCGRRYKKPIATPALTVNGQQIVEKDAIVLELGRHFATAENGEEMSFRRLLEGREAVGRSAPDELCGQDLVTLPELARGFMGLQSHKVPGMTNIPAEAYKYAPREAAVTHWPILAKAMMRGTVPSLWQGTLVVGIGKPGKDMGVPEGWRSIALAEAASKGVAKALREKMLPAFQRIASEAQCGANKGSPIEYPSHIVRAYLQAAKQHGVSRGVVFIDGRSAYYATLREHLFDGVDLEIPHRLRALLSALHPDPKKQDVLFAMLTGPGLLTKSDTPRGVYSYLQAAMSNSWYTLRPESGICFRTSTGTVPGTPIADLLFSWTGSNSA